MATKQTDEKNAFLTKSFLIPLITAAVSLVTVFGLDLGLTDADKGQIAGGIIAAWPVVSLLVRRVTSTRATFTAKPDVGDLK